MPTLRKAPGDRCIGDTTGPGGLFKALRTVPVFLDVLRDVPEAKVVGLCHSVQGASHALASWCGVPYPELEFEGDLVRMDLKEIATGRSWEYASYIIEAMETNVPFVIYGNLPNRNGLISNLPGDGVVEVGK